MAEKFILPERMEGAPVGAINQIPDPRKINEELLSLNVTNTYNFGEKSVSN